MSRGRRRALGDRKREQISISVKVSAEQKAAVLAECGRLGCTTSELIIRSVLGRAPQSYALTDNARAHLAAAHAVRVRALSGAPLDPQLLSELLAVTQALIGELRRSAA